MKMIFKKTGSEGISLAHKLRIIELLLLVVPLLVIFYIAWQSGFSLSRDQSIIIGSVLLLLIAGMLLLKNAFSQFDRTARLVKKSSEEAIELAPEDDNVTSEMKEIADSFNNLVRKFNTAGVDLSRKSFELNTLKEMMEMVRSRENELDMLNSFLDKAIKVTGADHGSILLEEDAGNLQVREIRQTGTGNGQAAEMTDSDRGFLFRQLKSGVEKGRSGFFYSSPYFLSMPISIHGELLAVVNLVSESDKQFRKDDEEILNLLHDEICFALENSRLNQKVQENLKIIQERAELLEKHVKAREKTERQLQDVNVRFFAVIQSVPDLISFRDVSGRYLLVNPAFEDNLGVSRDSIMGRTAEDVFSPGMAMSITQSDDSVIRMRMASRFEHSLSCNGRTIILDTIKTPIYDSAGGLAGILVVSRDITARKQMESLYETLANSSPVGVYVVQEGVLRFANPKFREYAGLRETEMIGLNPLDIVHPDDRESVRENAHKMLKAERATAYEYRIVCKGGETKWIMETVLPITYGGKRAVLGNAVDFTAKRKAEEALRDSQQKYKELSITDDLTRLYNSRHFFIQIAAEVNRASRYGKPLSILLIDMDNFKKFNDTLGHLAGDQLLIRLGEVMNRNIRLTDSAYRYGGDEFIVLLPETPGQEASRAAERIRADFIDDFTQRHGSSIPVTLSIGVAEYLRNEEAKDFIKRADASMYMAKQGGRNRVCYN